MYLILGDFDDTLDMTEGLVSMMFDGEILDEGIRS